MKLQLLLVLVGLAALAYARPDVLDFEGDDHEHEQEGNPGSSVEGTYSWTSPEGQEFYVKYVADEDGYRVVESNALPLTHEGVAADGNQGSFDDEEEGGEGDEE
ncbi:uncharacterized protein LOC122253765 [Penaeus japonicus]|uniref:uncharacterized protein LOC122253765 n=1 Tax=Penaeus japonicus TaxID=27405 RepID=UPI001C715A3B|nr:uncharacterized protein LOC122253765 [Penaeus japonicus]